MQITIQNDGTTRTITLSGKMDTVTAPMLESAIEESAETVRALILDLQGLTYTSSAGLRVLLRAQKRLQQFDGMRLVHVQPDVMEVLEMTGFDTILTIE